MGRDIRKYQAGGEYREDGHEVYLKYTVKPNTPEQVAGGGSGRRTTYPKLDKPTTPKEEKLEWDSKNALNGDIINVNIAMFKAREKIGEITRDASKTQAEKSSLINAVTTEVLTHQGLSTERWNKYQKAKTHTEGMEGELAIVPGKAGNVWAKDMESGKLVEVSESDLRITFKRGKVVSNKYRVQTIDKMYDYINTEENVVDANGYNTELLAFLGTVKGYEISNTTINDRIKALGSEEIITEHVRKDGDDDASMKGSDHRRYKNSDKATAASMESLFNDIYYNRGGVGSSLWSSYYSDGKRTGISASDYIWNILLKRYEGSANSVSEVKDIIEKKRDGNTIRSVGGVEIGAVSGAGIVSRYIRDAAKVAETELEYTGVGDVNTTKQMVMKVKGIDVGNYSDLLAKKKAGPTSYESGLNIFELYDSGDYGTEGDGSLHDVVERQIYDVQGNEITNQELSGAGMGTLPQRMSIRSINHMVFMPVTEDGVMFNQKQRDDFALVYADAIIDAGTTTGDAKKIRLNNYIDKKYGYIPEMKGFLSMTATYDATVLEDKGTKYLETLRGSKKLDDSQTMDAISIAGISSKGFGKRYDPKINPNRFMGDEAFGTIYDNDFKDMIIFMPLKSIMDLQAAGGDVYTPKARLSYKFLRTQDIARALVTGSKNKATI